MWNNGEQIDKDTYKTLGQQFGIPGIEKLN